MEYTECGLKNAIRMASTNPAKLFSLNELGEIEIGKRGDLIQFTMENNRMNILKTYVNGSLVHSQD